MATLKTSPSVARGSNCPPESDWPNVAAGLMEGSKAEGLLSHAAGCDHCGPLLRRSLADFSDDVSDEEQSLLAALPSFRPDWQGRMAARMASSTRQKGLRRWLHWKEFGGHPIPAWAYAAGVVLMAAAGMWIYTQTQRPIEELLAAAYTDQRTLELRLPDAAYAPLRLVRGSTDRSRLDRPPALLESEARIARELQKSPASARWLEAQGRADLLDRNFDAAIASLQHSLTLQPDSPSVITDLASAYFERAEANESQADYATAADLLGRVLTSAPDDLIALFNRAIIYDRMHLHDQAIADWRHYLRVDTTSGWISEARERLVRVEQSKK